MKLQPASKKEVLRISVGTTICLAIMLAVFFVLSLFDIVKFDHKVILGGVVGAVIAVVNFTILCLTVQKAAAVEDKKAMKARFQVSYNLRLIFQAAWVVAAFLLKDIFNVVAAALPLLFPTLVIFFLQSRGKLVTPSERKNPPEEPEETEEKLDTFEA